MAIGDDFTCEHCGGEFTKGISDEDAAAEHEAVWGTPEPEDAATICDGCYRALLAWADKQGLTVDGRPDP